MAEKKDLQIIAGSGEIYMMEFTGEIPEDAEIEVANNQYGYTKGGATLTYSITSETIQDDLREAAARPGAFVCEYGFFREAYRLEARRAARSGTSVHIALITVSLPDGGMPPLTVLAATMDQLQEVLTGSLRRGDVVSKYSGAQFVVMLPAANFENSTMVMERVVSAFYRQHRRNFLKLSYKIRALD